MTAVASEPRFPTPGFAGSSGPRLAQTATPPPAPVAAAVDRPPLASIRMSKKQPIPTSPPTPRTSTAPTPAENDLSTSSLLSNALLATACIALATGLGFLFASAVYGYRGLG